MSSESSSERPVCTVQKFGERPATQHLYKCLSCSLMHENEVVCEGCKEFCHSGHEMVDLGWCYGVCGCGVGSKGTHCYLMHPVPGDDTFEPGQNKQCRTTMTGNTFVQEQHFYCANCDMGSNLCFCWPCMHLCHMLHGHEIRGRSNSGGYYCDCPLYERFNCQIKPYPNDDKEKYCSQFYGPNFPDVTVVMCETCQVYVCQSCREKCHAGHAIVDQPRQGRCECPRTVCVDVANKEPAA